MHDDGFDDFDWNAWGEPGNENDDSASGEAADRAAINGHGHVPPGERSSEDSEGRRAGWVTAGGVVQWEEPEGEPDPQIEGESPLAADDLAMPEGAPDAPRVRAVHAWIVRQRAREMDALGGLLMTQRAQRVVDDEQRPARGRGARRQEAQFSPLELAITEHQAAADEYATQLEQLDEQVAHAGSGMALVEYHLWLTDYLAELAASPDADDTAGPASTRAGAIWRGRALATLAVRGRVERVSAPFAEED